MGKKKMPEGATEESLLAELREAIEGVEDTDGYTEPDATLLRYLKARDWSVKAAAKQLIASLEWRAEYKPSTITCTYCENRKGYHSWRQVGFDKEGETGGLVPADCVMHAAYLIENLVPSITTDASTYVWILDFTGINMGSVNPRLAYATNKVMSQHYPERLGYVLLVNTPWLFSATWTACKTFMDSETVAKIIFVKDSQLEDTLRERMPEELAEWALTEIEMNRNIKANPHQVDWYLPPPEGFDHDPRGCPSYLRDYVEPFMSDPTKGEAEQTPCDDGHVRFNSKVHFPHPNFPPASKEADE